jgi:acylphosphatase
MEKPVPEAGGNGQRIVRVRISGLVQGVGFRAWTRKEASALGLTGFVRNRRDGDVEALFAGPHDAVAVICAACQHGPPSACVEKVTVEETDISALTQAGAPGGFQQIATL